MTDGTSNISILRTKLTRPKVHNKWVQRPRLISRLDEGLNRGATLISAPAGFGKTTLAVQWLDQLPRLSAWLSLDKNDNDPERFLKYVVAAIRSIVPGFGSAIEPFLSSPTLPPPDYLADGMISEVEALKDRIVLVLDDCHTFTFDAVQKILARIMEHPPENLHLVMLTRADPPLPLGLLAFIMAYPYLPGSSSEAFRGVSIFAGLIVSPGSASVFGQVMAGPTLMYSRAFQPGDYVLASENEGLVLSVGYLSTKILTARQEEINIPNSVLLSTATKNYSRAEGGKELPLFVRVGIGYSTPWRQIHQLLLDAARQTRGVQTEPAPQVYQVELGDFYVTYELSVFLDVTSPRRLTVSALHENIQDAFNRAGVQIMSPHYVSDPAEKVWVPPDQWEPNPCGDHVHDSTDERSTPREDVPGTSV